MKRILCYGDSNVWGFVPGSFNSNTKLATRHARANLWTTVLQNRLGNTYEIFSDGINGRTTDLDEINPGRPYRNGLDYLGYSLELHYPIHLIIFWLGSNDTKKQYNRSVNEINIGLKKLVTFVKKSRLGENNSPPKILIVCPPPIKENSHPEFNYESVIKSGKLAKIFYDLSIEMNCEFLDAGIYIQTSAMDGIHLDSESCYIIGNKIADKIELI
ncbi:GDSL-type esterase/lipase family protein [Pigmentibacter ruber]|uniref:GDSL-type esterase/lipase family protein n=1 Tax=Pigmentibacter ruber TaxID=2683196 RepID=UPI00131D4AF4|nr:GDSL-type esterase/lipase family protein [Pigmentibacter ruber]